MGSEIKLGINKEGNNYLRFVGRMIFHPNFQINLGALAKAPKSLRGGTGGGGISTSA